MVIGNIFLGLIMMAIGTLMLKFNFQLSNQFSHNNVFERYLGSGATYFVMQVAAILAVLGGFFVMFGVADNVLGWLLSPITNLFR